MSTLRTEAQRLLYAAIGDDWVRSDRVWPRLQEAVRARVEATPVYQERLREIDGSAAQYRAWDYDPEQIKREAFSYYANQVLRTILPHDVSGVARQLAKRDLIEIRTPGGMHESSYRRTNVL